MHLICKWLSQQDPKTKTKKKQHNCLIRDLRTKTKTKTKKKPRKQKKQKNKTFQILFGLRLMFVFFGFPRGFLFFCGDLEQTKKISGFLFFG